MNVPEARGVRVVAVSDDAKRQWDDYVSEQETGNLLQAWGWGELRRRYGWRVFRLAAIRRPDAQWVGAIQVLQQGIGPGGVGWGYSPQGPVLSSLGDVEAGQALLRAAARRLRHQ